MSHFLIPDDLCQNVIVFFVFIFCLLLVSMSSSPAVTNFFSLLLFMVLFHHEMFFVLNFAFVFANISYFLETLATQDGRLYDNHDRGP